MLTANVDAKEEQNVLSAEVPNAFIQIKVTDIEDGEEQAITKITWVLVYLLAEMAPEVYGPYIVFGNGRKVLYVQVLRAF